MLVLRFGNEAEATRWVNDVEAIKAQIAWINTQGVPEPRMSLYRDTWVPMVLAFERTFGSDMVPADIRAALEDVQAALAERSS